MNRISSDMPFSNSQFFLRRQEAAISNMQNRISGQNRLVELRDDPLAASRAVRYESFLARLNRFEQNTRFAMDHYTMIHESMNSSINILQRMRELAVTGAHGIYSQEDLSIMGTELNELLLELVSIANRVGPGVKQMFSGDSVFSEPFRIVEGVVQGGHGNMVVRVEYRGSGATRSTEISEGTRLELDMAGGDAFWAERMQIFSQVDATDYRVSEPGSFFLSGVEIPVSVGDTLPSIVARINDSAAPVRASVDPQTNGLVLEGTTAHFIRAEDGQTGATVLADLGIISGNMVNNAPNWASDASVHGGSIFDMAIRLRDAMFRGDHEFIGSLGIGGMDLAIDNFVGRMAEIGSRQERAELTWQRINREIPNVTGMLSRETGLDMASAATDLQWMHMAHQATLATAARVLPQTLLDFLR
ncbi:MAG: flagellar hook-associated protein 3 [Spirochaetes bacterium]|nr:flagellar hook-associated protein 3 [Spirochaetota bacterium]